MKKKIFALFISCIVLSSLTACGFHVGTEIPIDEIIKTEESTDIENSSIEEITENNIESSDDKIELSTLGNDYYGSISIPGTYNSNENDMGLTYSNEDGNMMISFFRYENNADSIIDVLKESIQSLLASYNSTEDIYVSSLKDLGYDKEGYLLCGVIPESDNNYYLLNFYLFQNEDGTSSYISIEGDYYTINIEDFREDIINTYTQPKEGFAISDSSLSTDDSLSTDIKTINSIITDTDYDVKIPSGYQVASDDSDSFIIFTDEEGNTINVKTAVSSRILKYIEVGKPSENENFTFENMGAYKTSLGTFTFVREYSTYDESSFNQYYLILDNNDFEVDFLPYNSKPVTKEDLIEIIQSILIK